jgi:hypothetical protein
VTPYGAPVVPSVSATGGATTVSLAASTASNGCGATLYFRVDGGGWQTAASSWSGAVGNGYNQGHSIEAYSTDSCGQTSATASTSASSGPPPTPRVFLTRDGGSAPVGQYIVAHTENLPAGTYDYKCYDDGAPFTKTDGTVWDMVDVAFPANGTVRLGCYAGTGLGVITIQIFNVPGYGTVGSEGASW